VKVCPSHQEDVSSRFFSCSQKGYQLSEILRRAKARAIHPWTRYISNMNGMNVEAEKLRPDLHRRIDSMDLEQLELLRRILLKLELSEVVDRLHDAFDTARTSGTFNRVDEIIREVRTENPYA
jgi:hypothetical protein